MDFIPSPGGLDAPSTLRQMFFNIDVSLGFHLGLSSTGNRRFSFVFSDSGSCVSVWVNQRLDTSGVGLSSAHVCYSGVMALHLNPQFQVFDLR